MTAWLFSRTGGWQRAEYQCGYCQQRKLYLKRNCRKFFPELVQIDRKPCWAPSATVDVQQDGRTVKKQKAVSGFAINECPTSYITPQSLWLLDLAMSAGTALRESGASLFGPDARKWPAWFLDALAAIAAARNAYDAAEAEAR